jgi:hypothetical protein
MSPPEYGLAFKIEFCEVLGKWKLGLPPNVWGMGTERSLLMRERGLTVAEIMLIGSTRVALGAGLGLLIGDRFSCDTRKGAGWALLAVGVLSTVPLVMHVLGKREIAERA